MKQLSMFIHEQNDKIQKMIVQSDQTSKYLHLISSDANR